MLRSSSSTTLGTSSTPSSLTSSTPVVGLPGATQSPIGGGLSASTPVVGLPGATQSPIGGGQSSTPAVPGSSASSTTAGVATSATSIVGSAISNAPVPSNAVPTAAPTGAPYDPGHTPGAQQATLSVGQAYQDSILFHHNEARANHNAAPLYWNQTVADTAAVAANTCNFAHLIPTGAGQGQNLFTVSGDDFNVTAGITESWYKGEFQAMLPYFGKADIPTDVFHNVGHLTQVLWKATTSVGCVSIDCGDHMTVGGQTGSPLNKYTVCNYYPAGNVGTQYAINVGQPISTTNLGSWLD
ncbi:hypothetical protein N0V86_005866 [Didymella sp. IMI 355093]|nr:hypothetical protein N0V86_005866 [Didymella sp. IMI 355093]